MKSTYNKEGLQDYSGGSSAKARSEARSLPSLPLPPPRQAGQNNPVLWCHPPALQFSFKSAASWTHLAFFFSGSAFHSLPIILETSPKAAPSPASSEATGNRSFAYKLYAEGVRFTFSDEDFLDEEFFLDLRCGISLPAAT
mmetsp:Transcript_20409/g.46534  ORF Transcript_20409/g.46534 Transcript_20409/m.46534 type:complete len:141 (-) Transcript_20409:494-916(-)